MLHGPIGFCIKLVPLCLRVTDRFVIRFESLSKTALGILLGKKELLGSADVFRGKFGIPEIPISRELCFRLSINICGCFPGPG